MYRLLITIIILFSLTGCFTPPWTATTKAEYVATDFNVALKLPAGWMVNARKDIMLATRDGYLLQYISIENINVEDDLTSTKKKFQRGMLPLELAEVVLDNMSGKEHYTGFKVLSKKPAKVAGHQAFRAEYRFKDSDGLEYNGIYYGFIQNDWFYGIRYVAPKRHYYNRNKNDFEKAIKSLRLLV